MVYRGRPSTGCLKCRKRKIKCDERRDSCLKCSEKGFECPGYEDPLDRFFQDESENVKEKAIKSKAKAIALRDKQALTLRPKPSQSRPITPDLDILVETPILGPLIDQGVNFFMANYSLGVDEPPVHSTFYHRHLSTHGFHPVAAASMTALGLAGIANLLRDGYLQKEATQWYLKALNLTNAALANPHEVKSDSTLLSTMLLSVYEQTANDKTFSGWSNHVSGSSQLIRLRGKDQFATPAGRRMYMQIASLAVMNCMGKGESIPKWLHTLNNSVMENEDPNHPMTKFYHLNIKVIDFRAEISQSRMTDLHAIVDRAIELDSIAQGIFDHVGSTWDPQIIEVKEGTPNVFGTRYHTYPHQSAAQTWNWVRYNRIYIHDIIRNALILGISMSPPAFVGSYYAHLLDESTTTLYKMQAGILASVPQHLSDTPKYMSLIASKGATTTFASPGGPKRPFLWSNFSDSEPTEFFRTKAVIEERLPQLRLSGGYSFLWSLYVAGATSISTPDVHEYVFHSLARMADEFGVNQAKLLVTALRLKIQMDRDGSQVFEIVPPYLPRKGSHME